MVVRQCSDAANERLHVLKIIQLCNVCELADITWQMLHTVAANAGKQTRVGVATKKAFFSDLSEYEHTHAVFIAQNSA